MLDTLSRVVIFFGFIAAGAVLARTGRLTYQGLDGLSAYFYWLGFPCWLAVSFSQLPHFDSSHAILFAGYAAAMITTAGIVLLVATLRKTPREQAATAGMSGFINNSAFLGIPIAFSLFGQSAREIGPLVVAVDFLLLFSLGCAAMAKSSGHTFKEALIRTAKNPTVIGALIGVGLLLFGQRFPAPIETALDLLGKSGPPVALVALGGMLGMMEWRNLASFDPLSGLAVAAKILLAPALVALTLYLLKADPTTFKICVFLAATPTAVSVFIQARIYQVWYEGAAKTVAQSTVFSLITLSVLALILTHT
ncbi:transporter [Asticcacaulis sp. AC460]|uniref:AEC family transporter n=1 Tax=Asticcacaulis sp. AC460 TaxID=1282360 RepID=UPI0003C3DC9B|nr:AEC family transporter [Asticcacaulis sp. AC460]ESQ87227.1 transporter [Asticcacaulis sp. AC460]